MHIKKHIMKRFFIILLLFPILCLGIHDQARQDEEQEILRIQERIYQIDRDSSLSIETAWYHQGDGDFQYTVYRNTDEIMKLKRSLFVGGEELHQTVYFPDRPSPLAVNQVSIQYLEDQKFRQSEKVSYYAEGKLQSVRARTCEYGKYASSPIPDEPWVPQLEQLDHIFEENQTLISRLLTEIEAPSFLPAKLYKGSYTYAFDTEFFVESETDQRYQLEHQILRQAYLRLQPEVFEKVNVILVATMDMQEDLSGKMTETLTLVDFISMEKK